ncbi:MAG: DUF4435 domain-containing protein [Methanolobus sp.]|nr:DUF4435 domain-containing protein [Methanolobus sp.]
MREQITSHRIANHVRMRRQVSLNSILLVEGRTDKRIFADIVDEDHCDIVYAVYKDKLLSALSILEKSGEKGILGIVDADYWHVNQISPQRYSDNLLSTDSHDMDTMILASQALEKLLSEYATEFKLQSLGRPIREILLESGAAIGYIRWASRKYNLNIDFKFLNFYKFVDTKNLKINKNRLYRELKSKTSNRDMNDAMVKKHINGLVKLNADQWNICQGHDLVEILTIGLKEIFGNHAKDHVDSDIVSRNLRLAYNLSHFSDTKLYTSIKAWEGTNSKFRILLRA